MQTPKARTPSLEVPKRSSPVTAQTARQIKMAGSETDSPASRTPKDRSPKVIVRRSPRSPVSEPQKKRPSRVSELDAQLAQLQEDLKKAKDQLGLSESWKRNAQQEAEEAKRQLVTMNAKVDESQRQLLELSASEDDRLQELRKLSQERDRAWESELEAVKKQYSVDSATVVSAMNEIQRLKVQLEMVAESEATQIKHAEAAKAQLQSLRQEHAETLTLVENMKTQLHDCKESEARAKALLTKTLLQLETANTNVETLQSDGRKAMEAYSSVVSELEQSRMQVSSLEELVCKLEQDLVHARRNSLEDLSHDGKVSQKFGENVLIEELNSIKAELDSVKLEAESLRSALEIAEIKYQEEQIRSTMHLRSAYELVEQRKSESTVREAELQAALKKTREDMEQLKANLMDKETKLQDILQDNGVMCLDIENKQIVSALEMEVKKLKANIAELKANLMDKETELQYISEENEVLKSEINTREIEQAKVNNEAVTEAEAARSAEREALMRLDNVTEEAYKSSRRATWVAEQLEEAQATNVKLEVELRRLKVQSDQWRKAAEAAAAIISTEDNEKIVERSVSLDSNFDPFTGKVSSPYLMDDDSPKRRNGNMLKKIGGLWKKGQK